MSWMSAHADFSARYARARDVGLDERADELAELMAAEPDVQRARMIGEHGRWYLSKLAPRRYGDRLALAGDSDAPLTVQVLRLTDASD